MAQTIVGRGTSSDPRAIPLATKKKFSLRNERRPQLPRARMRAALQIFSAEHPSLRPRSLSSTYNCVGMVFASRRTWVDPRWIPQILRDDGYRKTTREESECGDVVLYRDPRDKIVHVGLVVCRRVVTRANEPDILVLSQWGSDGEYFHDIDDVSEMLGSPQEFWTERLS